ncbi:hypothetical protein BDF19DRAFT_424018 [Syncephalis fuscata]|nr:hypothetical protein BDF19DRAFT_424018 [Syncephalis fuscata]
MKAGLATSTPPPVSIYSFAASTCTVKNVPPVDIQVHRPDTVPFPSYSESESASNSNYLMAIPKANSLNVCPSSTPVEELSETASMLGKHLTFAAADDAIFDRICKQLDDLLVSAEEAIFAPNIDVQTNDLLNRPYKVPTRRFSYQMPAAPLSPSIPNSCHDKNAQLCDFYQFPSKSDSHLPYDSSDNRTVKYHYTDQYHNESNNLLTPVAAVTPVQPCYLHLSIEQQQQQQQQQQRQQQQPCNLPESLNELSLACRRCEKKQQTPLELLGEFPILVYHLYNRISALAGWLVRLILACWTHRGMLIRVLFKIIPTLRQRLRRNDKLVCESCRRVITKKNDASTNTEP